MLIFGIDPGTNNCGFAVLKDSVLCDYGTIKAKRSRNRFERIQQISQKLRATFCKHTHGLGVPAVLAIEAGFAGKNPSTSLVIGEARGMVVSCAGQFALPVVEYKPSVVKKVVAGNGAAKKAQVATALETVFAELRGKKLGDDTTDAIAIAWTHYLKV